jgi:PAS domain S-box-containing protein
MTTKRQIPERDEILSLVFAVVLVIFIALLAYRSWNALSASREQLEISRQITSGTTALLTSLVDAETGQRGFLLTGEDRYLEPYRKALADMPATFDNLTRAAGTGRQDQTERIERLKPLVKDKLDELNETIEIRRSKGFDAAVAVVSTNRGKSDMDQIRSICTEIQSAANTRMERFSEDSRASANQVSLIGTLGSGALLVLLLFSTITIRKANRQRNELIAQLQDSEERITEARDWLQTTLASIGDAVIATDASGKITFLNTVAQGLTGWTQEQAAGKPLEDVFVIRNEKTGVTVENPVSKALREGRIVDLANHTILIAKDGSRIPIEDSAAPIKDEQKSVLGVVLVFRDVTERRKSEDTVTRSEERLKLALDAGQIGVWDWDVTQNSINWSDRVYDIHGVERGKFSGRIEDFASLVHQEDQAGIKQAIQAALLHDVPYNVEFRVIHPDGNVVWVATAGLVFRNEKGEPARMLGTATNITARKEAEARLRQQWHTFDTALSNTPDFTYIFDLEGRFTYVNQALLSLWQKPLEEAVGKNFFELDYPTELAGRLQRQIQEVINTKGPVKDDTPFTGPTGETRYYEYIFVPILARNGNLEAVAGSTRDTTERSRAEAALRTSEERLTLALEAGGGVGTWDWDVPNDRIYCNAQFAKLYSIGSEKAVTGAPLSDFLTHIYPEDRDRIVKSLQFARETGGELSEEHRLVQQDGSVRWVHARGRCHRDQAGNASRFPGVLFDVTERRRAEEELRRSNQDLIRANRELEEFAYVASHDLQEPLRMVNIYTQLITRDLGPERANLRQYADFVQQGVSRMEILIHDLLTFSRTVHDDELQVGTADLPASLAEAMAVLKDRVEESGSVITAETLPRVRGDESQLAHVFQNLLSNAMKYHKKHVPPQIQIRAVQKDGRWVISVEDNGIGFEQKYEERIFGLFKRLHSNDYPGTGLGLAICRRIVERYGGRIWAEGRPDEGSTFYFELPAPDQAKDK